MVIHSAYYRSPLGLVRLRGTRHEILSLDFSGTPPRTRQDLTPALKKCIRELREYFSGQRRRFSVKMRMEGTDFQKKIWKRLRELPYGQRSSYGDIARQAGHPSAVRAVAGAIGRNPLLLLIPCHRVIAKNGSLAGYAYGIRRKAWLLRHERLRPIQKSLYHKG